MLAPLDDAEDAANGIQSIQHAMTSLVGGWGRDSWRSSMLAFFAFSSIVANYIYAENNRIFLRINSPRHIWALPRSSLWSWLSPASLVGLPVVWQLADTIMAALMAITNPPLHFTAVACGTDHRQ